MNDFIKLHDKDDHAEFAIRVDTIREIYDTGIESGTQICFDSYNQKAEIFIAEIYVEESVSEILRLIERVKNEDKL